MNGKVYFYESEINDFGNFELIKIFVFGYCKIILNVVCFVNDLWVDSVN